MSSSVVVSGSVSQSLEEASVEQRGLVVGAGETLEKIDEEAEIERDQQVKLQQQQQQQQQQLQLQQQSMDNTIASGSVGAGDVESAVTSSQVKISGIYLNKQKVYT